MKNSDIMINESIAPQKSGITKFFDAIDKIDRWLYGKRMQYFAWGIVIVLIIAPILDLTLEVPHDRLSWLSTFLFFIFLLIMILSWLSSWRDDAGQWTWQRAKSKLLSYYESLKDMSDEARTTSSEEFLYKTGKLLIVLALFFQALRNISVLLRKPLENLTQRHRIGMRHFEANVHSYYWIPLLSGIAILYYMYKKNPNTMARLKNELRVLFGGKSTNGEKYHNEVVRINASSKEELVINAKLENHVQMVVTQNKSSLFNDFVNVISQWNPRGCHYEYEFQDRLCTYLRKKMPEAIIESEVPIGDNSMGNKGRADIIINDTILIEMKRDTSAGAIQRAKGQILQYSEVWKDKGPVVLLLCDYDYEHAKVSYSSTISTLTNIERSALAIVAKPKS